MINLTQEAIDRLLTSQERKIYELLPQGLPNKSIAYVLNRSVQTIKNQIFTMCRKKNARNRSHLTAMAAVDALRETGARLDVDPKRWYYGWSIHTLNGVPLSRPLVIKGRGTLVWIPDEITRGTERR